MKFVLKKGFLPKISLIFFSILSSTDFASPNALDCAKFYGPSALINSLVFGLKNRHRVEMCRKACSEGNSKYIPLINNADFLLSPFIPYFTNGLVVKASPFLKKLKPQDSLLQKVQEISKKLSVGCPKVYLFESEKLISSFVGLNNLVLSRGFLKLLTDDELVAYLSSMLGSCLGSCAWLNDDLTGRLVNFGERFVFCLAEQFIFRWLTKKLDFQKTTNFFSPNFELNMMSWFVDKMDTDKNQERFIYLLGYYFIKKSILESLTNKISEKIVLKNAHRGDRKSVDCFGLPEVLISALEKLKRAKFFEGPSLGEFVASDLAEGNLRLYQYDLSLINGAVQNNCPKKCEKCMKFLELAPTSKNSNEELVIYGLNSALRFYKAFSKTNKNWLVDGRIKKIKALMTAKEQAA